MDEYKAFAELMKDMLEYKKKEAKLLFILLIISFIVNIAQVGAFLWFESQWEFNDTITTTTTTEQSVDGDDGSIVNGDQYNDQSQNKSGGEDKWQQNRE